jgi:hypothetical protein
VRLLLGLACDQLQLHDWLPGGIEARHHDSIDRGKRPNGGWLISNLSKRIGEYGSVKR